MAFVGMPFCFLVQNFAEIRKSVDQLWPKKAIFKMAAFNYARIILAYCKKTFYLPMQ